MIRSLALSVTLVLAAGLAACAPAVGDRDSPRPRADRITAEEIAATNFEHALDVVQLLRPQWLRSRGQRSIRSPGPTEVVVYLDGTRVGGAAYLQRLRANAVTSMQYLSASDATTRYGTGHSGGVILVSTGRD